LNKQHICSYNLCKNSSCAV